MSVIRHPSTGTAVTVKQWRYTATGGETTLSGTDGFGLSLSYTVGAEEVYINGVLLVRGTDYTASTGTSITGLTALVAGDVATVMSANSFNVANAIAASTVTAKGDLIVANGASSVSNLAVGADGTTLVANSSSSTGVAWAGPISAAGKNRVINGDMSVWQRGTSFSYPTGTLNTYFADRWTSSNGSGSTFTLSQQATSDTTNLPFIRYCARVQRNSGQTSSSNINVAQSLETATSIPLAGKTITVSFYARAGSNYSGSANGLGVYLSYGTGTDQNILTGFTGQTNPIATTATLTTTWQRFSYTTSLPSTATQVSILYSFTPTGTAGSNDYYDFTGTQIEIGSIATPFQTATGTLQGELAACQRYYETAWYQVQYSTQMQTDSKIQFRVSKRTAPSVTVDDGVGNAGKVGFKTAYLGGGSGNQTGFGITNQFVDGFELYDLTNNYGKFFDWFASAEL